MTTALPRFTGPAQVRQRMRSIAALGLLAIAALAIGGLASLSDERRGPGGSAGGAELGAASVGERPHLIDPTELVEARVAEAERAYTRARAAIRSARQLGLVPSEQLDQLERRLAAQAQGQAVVPTPAGAPALAPVDRSLARTPAAPKGRAPIGATLEPSPPRAL